jgi:cytochrome c553
MRNLKMGIGFVCFALLTHADAQNPAPSVPQPPSPQRMPIAYRPIRVPQLAPLTPPVVPAPDVQIPLAPQEPQPFQGFRTGPMFAPAGVNGQPGQPFAPGQPLQPIPNFQPGQPGIQPAFQPPPPRQPATYLTWNTERIETNVAVGQATAQFTFWLTNVSTEVVSINSVRTSCGCTVAQLPSQPWQIPAGSNGPINVTMNLAGKMGSIEKAVTIDSSTGIKTLIVRSNIPMQPNAQPTAGGIDPERLKNMQMALADRQVVFKGECAKCHAEPAVAKMDKPLYDAACGICHDSTHRAAMVPDLANLKHPTNEEHWRKWIKSGRPGSMMPAFAKSEGGPLTDEQVESLVKFLTESITAKKPATVVTPVSNSAQAQPAAPHDSVSAFPLPKTKVVQ